MGFYFSTLIVDRNNKVICTINTEKGGIGYGNLCFRKEDFTIDVPKRIYIAKTPVSTATERVKKIYHEVVNEKNQKIKDKMLDEWSQKALDYAISFMENMLSIFESVSKRYKSAYVYVDFSEAVCLYKKTEDIDPEKDFHNNVRFLKNVLNGCYNGKYLSPTLRQEADNFIANFKEGLLKFDGILDIFNFGTSYEPHLFNLGGQKMIKFQLDIKLSNESIEEDYDIVDNVLLPTRPYFIANGCDYEIDYSASYVRKDGQVRISVYKFIGEN